MPGRRSEPHERHIHPHDASHQAARRPCLYELVLRQAIATQHGLTTTERLDLRLCDECGKAYLLTSVWLPHSESGEIACPRCGVCAIAWDGSRGYLAYWQRESRLCERRPRNVTAVRR